MKGRMSAVQGKEVGVGDLGYRLTEQVSRPQQIPHLPRSRPREVLLAMPCAQ